MAQAEKLIEAATYLINSTYIHLTKAEHPKVKENIDSLQHLCDELKIKKFEEFQSENAFVMILLREISDLTDPSGDASKNTIFKTLQANYDMHYPNFRLTTDGRFDHMLHPLYLHVIKNAHLFGEKEVLLTYARLLFSEGIESRSN